MGSKLIEADTKIDFEILKEIKKNIPRETKYITSLNLLITREGDVIIIFTANVEQPDIESVWISKAFSQTETIMKIPPQPLNYKIAIWHVRDRRKGSGPHTVRQPKGPGLPRSSRFV